MNAVDAIQTLAVLFDKYGEKHYGEQVSQSQHAVQSARLAAQAGMDDEVILAACLHDIGHLLEETVSPEKREEAVFSHHTVGARFLRGLGFSDRVAELVEGHVDAKRYLVGIDAAYRHGLSPASRRSLAFQGGAMQRHEIETFEAQEDFLTFLAMRRWDDEAKNPEDPDRDLTPWLLMAKNHLESSTPVTA